MDLAKTFQFSSYLTERTQYVSLSNQSFAFAPVHSGVPHDNNNNNNGFSSREHISLSYKKWLEHRIRKKQQLKNTAHDGKSYLK